MTLSKFDEAVNLFEKDEIKKIRKMAILVLDILPEKKNDTGDVIESLDEIDECSTEGAIIIVKRAFECLSDEEMENAGVNIDEFEDIREKMDVVANADDNYEEDSDKCPDCDSSLISENGSMICPHCDCYMVR